MSQFLAPKIPSIQQTIEDLLSQVVASILRGQSHMDPLKCGQDLEGCNGQQEKSNKRNIQDLILLVSQ